MAAKLLRLYCLLVVVLFLQTFGAQLSAQNYQGLLRPHNSPALDLQFSNYEVFQLDARLLDAHVKSDIENTAQLTVGSHQWSLNLVPSRIVSANYSVRHATAQGVEVTYPQRNIAFKGYELHGGGKVRLTINGEFMYGFIDEPNERYYIEPLWYYEPMAPKDLFVLYPMSGVAPFTPDMCGMTEAQMELEHLEDAVNDKKENGAENNACYEVDIAIASDESMLSKYGSVGEVENHNIAVLNDVQGDYTGNFDHDLEFVIVTQFVSSNDPWSPSTDAGTLLGSFRTWGNNGNFGVAFDIGELWTDRDFNGGTIGIAYLNGVCNSNKYHCLQDFTGNGNLLRVLTSHELGHNFSSGHDANCPPPNFIMCPSVSNATEWSQQSTNAINAYVQSKINSGCLTACGPPPPPLVAAFGWDPNPGCQGQPVVFTDLSTGNITGWSWNFPGGSPPTSNQQNPSVTWNSPGFKDVTLTITGVGGSNAITQPLEILPLPSANFTFTVDGLEVTFTNTSLHATSYEWDFGDGFSSNEVNPVHEYAEAGIYIVVLTVTNECGTASRTSVVNTAPTADFIGSPTSGCATFVVAYENLSSSNATTFVWTFPGGTPATTNQPNPTVSYNAAGVYSATLKATNVSGSSTFTRTDYITVGAVPVANFTSVVNDPVVNFTNTTIGNASSYLWDFGDGDTSTVVSPSHTYANAGTYTVVLTAFNDCGSSTKTAEIVITSTDPPTAGFTADTLTGCAPLSVTFTNSSLGAVSYAWTFTGATPDNSTETNPTVVYNTPGVYTVTLIATNANGQDTFTRVDYITVNTLPASAGFTYVVSNDTTVTFTNTSVGATSYLWTFGDGDSSTVTNPVHHYAKLDTNRTYQVILWASNDCGTVSDTQLVTIVADPISGFTATPTSGCAPLTVVFTNTSSSNATSYNWQFPGGMPSSSTAQTPPNVVYDTPGTYTVTLTVSNAAGSSTSTQTITVDGPPMANFNSSVSVLTATFTNTSTGATSYLWDFGDGESSADANPVHDYIADGTYTVVLTATNDCGTSTFTKNVVITTEPGAGFSANNTSGCAVLTVNFTDISSGDPVSWAWDFPGGTPSSSTEENPTVEYFTPGVYDVTLVVTSIGGSTSSFSQPAFINVNGAPSAGFTSVANGSTVTFTNSSVGATSYSWVFGDGGTSMMADPVYTYAEDGVYNVTLSATNACGTTIFEQTVTVSTPPTAGFTVSGSSGCAPYSVTFTNASSSNATSFLWDFPGGNPSTSTEESPTVEWNTAGVYIVTLTATNASGSSTSTATITVAAQPTADFSYQLAGLTATFANLSSNGTDYTWDFGDGSDPSSEANPSHTYSQAGSYTVTLTVMGECGTVTATQVVEIVGSAPSPAISVDNLSGCFPLAVQFMDESVGDPTAWSWTFVGGTPASSTDENPLVSYAAAGTYDVILEVTNAFGSNSSTFPAYITVLGAPTAGFTYTTNQSTVNFTNTGQNGTSYSWNFGDGNTSTEENPTHVYAGGGSYTVSLSVTNNCGTTIYEETVVITVGTVEATWVSEFQLYPNPNSGTFTVSLVGVPQSEIAFTLFNALGQQVKRDVSEFKTGRLERTFEYGQLASGFYTLRVESNGEAMYVKVTVSK